MRFGTISIVGLGLMGASLAARCRRKFPAAKIIGISRSRSALKVAQRRSWIHWGTNDLVRGVANADLVVLATPVDTFPKYLNAIDRASKPGTFVTDVGSVKGRILKWVEGRKWKNICFVGAHPMAGSHRRGVESADPNLYDQGFTFIVRPKRNKARAFVAVKKFWSAVSPKVIMVKSEEHDRIVAEISHLPHAIAVCLVDSISNGTLNYSATGFRDSTRVALGDPSIWIPIFLENRKWLLHSLDIFQKRLNRFRKLLGRQKKTALALLLKSSMQKRKQI